MQAATVMVKCINQYRYHFLALPSGLLNDRMKYSRPLCSLNEAHYSPRTFCVTEDGQHTGGTRLLAINFNKFSNTTGYWVLKSHKGIR